MTIAKPAHRIFIAAAAALALGVAASAQDAAMSDDDAMMHDEEMSDDGMMDDEMPAESMDAATMDDDTMMDDEMMSDDDGMMDDAMPAEDMDDDSMMEDSGMDEAMMEPAPFGPSVGTNIAEVIAAPDSTGATRTFADLAGENGLVLNFNRSVDWCPFCKAQTVAVDEAFSEFADRGYNVVVLTTDTPRKLARYVAERDPSLTLISDADSTIIAALGLEDPQYPEGHRRHGLPYPETLILSPEGVVEARVALDDLYGQNNAFRERVAVSDVLAAIDALHPAM